MSEQAEQLVLDYLRQVGDAAYISLRAEERLDFLRRLRGRIDEMRASAGANEPDQVRKVLGRFGDPSALVTREQERLRYERSQREAATETSVTGSADEAATSPEAAQVAAETSEEGPITEPIPVVRGARGEQERARDGEQRQYAEREAQQQEEAESPLPSGSPSTPQARPRHTGPPLYEPRSPRQAGQEVPSALSRMFDHLPPEVRGALRGGVLEGVGLLFIGLGGALRPLPLWFMGALLVALAPGWAARDKVIGLLAPIVAILVGSGVLAGLDVRDGVQAYSQALQSYGWTLFRIGAVVGAVYLTTFVLTNRRRKHTARPAWRRIEGPQP